MEDIRVQFTYDITDDQYSKTNVLENTATGEYYGPAKQYWVIDVETDKWTGEVVEKAVHDSYNDDLTDGRYSVEVDCASNPLLCSLWSTAHTTVNQVTISEDIPNSIPYTREEPPDPIHTYERSAIYYNKALGKFNSLEWKNPYVSWEQLLFVRDNKLRNSDRQMSEDLPESLYNAMSEYRTYLRDFTKTYGVSWIVSLDVGGSGYQIGDRIAITDTRLKDAQNISDVIVTVTAVDSNGAITEFSTGSNRALHIESAVTYTNVYATTNGRGSGAMFTARKNKTIKPWKITPKESPLG